MGQQMEPEKFRPKKALEADSSGTSPTFRGPPRSPLYFSWPEKQGHLTWTSRGPTKKLTQYGPLILAQYWPKVRGYATSDGNFSHLPLWWFKVFFLPSSFQIYDRQCNWLEPQFQSIWPGRSPLWKLTGPIFQKIGPVNRHQRQAQFGNLRAPRTLTN